MKSYLLISVNDNVVRLTGVDIWYNCSGALWNKLNFKLINSFTFKRQINLFEDSTSQISASWKGTMRLAAKLLK